MSKKIDNEFGERLLVAAKKAGVPYSQTAIATFLSVRKQNVDAWMNGSVPKADQLFTMADKFGVDPRWLATGQVLQKSIPGEKQKNDGAEKILAAMKVMLESDWSEADEMLAAVQSLSGDHGTTGQRSKPKRANR